MSQLLSESPTETPPAEPAAPLEELLQQAIAHHRADRLLEAERLYRLLLAEHPDHPDAHHHLGVVTLALSGAAAALPHFQAALQAEPTRSQFWLSCVDALIRAAQFDAARRILELGIQGGLQGDAVRALQSRLQNAGAMGNASPVPQPKPEKAEPRPPQSSGPSPDEIGRLRALFDRGSDAQAETESLALSLTTRFPHSAYAWNILGSLRQRSSRYAEAAAFYQRALKADPDCIEAHYNLGRILQSDGDLIQAETCFRRAIALYPDLLEAHFCLGETLSRRDRYPEAEACFRRVLELQPDLAVAHNNLAITLKRQARPEESEASCRRALACKSDFAEAYCNLASALTDQARLVEAAATYRQALALQPNLTVAHHGLLFCLSHGGEIEPQALFEEHVRFADRFEAPLRPTWPRHRNAPDPERPLRVGIVSGDLRTHAMAHFIEPMFAALAQDPGLSLHAYSNHAAEDRVTYRLREHIPHWNRIFALSDEQLAAKIQADTIDILVDLTGHTAHSRLLTFARKPAPIQCGWIGYLGTSGLRSIDYYLADPHFLPPGEFEPFFTETIVHLPIVSAFRPSPDAPAINPLPALTSGQVTFASFSRLSKLSQPVIALWAQLMLALPESRILLAGMPREGRHEPLARWFEAEGIAPERLQFRRRCADHTYLELHHQIDIALDPFPFTGATTTSNALWMGVPTLTLTGRTVAGRLGPALLEHTGLADFVAHTPQEFIEKGIYWARHLDQLAELRAGMRERFLAHPIGQPVAAAQGLSSAFRAMWRSWCAETR
jgi:protein O-GlcNAc transferase